MSTVMWYREAPNRGPSGRLSKWLHKRRDQREDSERAAALTARLHAACYGVGLAEDTESCAGLPGLTVPKVESITFGPDMDRMIIRMMPGQAMSDWSKVADRLALHLGYGRIRIRPRPGPPQPFIRLELLRTDPLDTMVHLPMGLDWARQPLLLAGVETGELLHINLQEIMHLIVQGQTRSGKSRWVYGLLAQIAGCRDVLIAGSDITGLIARAFEGTHHEPFWASGAGDLRKHADVLEALVSEMDRRIANMPPRSDVYPTTPSDPLVFVVIEELAGLIEAAQAYDALHSKAPRGQAAPPKITDRIKGAYKRLMAEGAKAGFRVLLIVQRAEASIVGGFARGQASLKISFRVEDVESVKMLHPSVDPVTAVEHTIATAGLALVSGPGLPVQRVRSGNVPSYEWFIDQVQEACRRPAIEAP